ncbi:MAG: ABC transporter permease [Halobacteriaceae archaeon]
MVPRPRLPALLRKELAWGRRNLALLVVVFVLLPTGFAAGSAAFQTVLPTDAPVAVVPGSDAVTEDDLTITEGAVAPFSEPRVVRDRSAAFRMLEHEQVYAVVTVPAGITDPDTEAVFEVSVSGSVVPYHQASQAVVSVMNYVLERQLPAEYDVSVTRTVVGPERSLSEYLVPTMFLGLVMLVALVYLPYNLAREADAVDRVRVEHSLWAMTCWKLAVFGTLLAVPAGLFQLASAHFGYGVAIAAPGALFAALCAFLALGAVGMGVVLLARFSTLGRLLDVVLLLFLLAYSGLFYPAGFFSPLRRQFVRLVPTHYVAVAVRGFALRDAAFGEYATWLVGFVAMVAVALAFLRGSVAVYERGA